jgi:hypothetical protein
MVQRLKKDKISILYDHSINWIKDEKLEVKKVGFLSLCYFNFDYTFNFEIIKPIVKKVIFYY